jgi:hypothetical protein
MMSARAYAAAIKTVLTPRERAVFSRLKTAAGVQDFLDRLKPNYGPDTHMSPRRVLKLRKAHCTEGAMFAAACLLFHGRDAWLMDLRAVPADQDHVVCLFRENGRWGALSKSNHPVLRWRDPIYANPRELAMSYAHEYWVPDGRKSLLAFSRPFGLRRYAPACWVTADEELDWLMLELDDSKHFALAPKNALRRRRKATGYERRASDVTEYPVPRKKRRSKARRR